MGYFFDCILENIRFKCGKYLFLIILCGWGIGNLIPTILTYRDMYYYKITSLFVDNPFLIWSFVATLCLDGMILLLADRLKEYQKFNKVITYISSLTFGIYLLGDKLIEFILPYFANWGINAVVKILSVDILIFVVGALISMVLKQIPLIRKLL